MTPDISRVSFDPAKRFSRVIMQQGRVQLDSDWNEQVEITLTTVRHMFVDLVGPFAAPPDDPPDVTNFQIGLLPPPPASATDTTSKDLSVGKGRYYVDGILCDNPDGEVTYTNQPDLDVSGSVEDFAARFPFLVYLDVWEEPVTALDDPGLLEPGLGGPDTTARTRVAWAVRAEAFAESAPKGGNTTGTQFPNPPPYDPKDSLFGKLSPDSPAYSAAPGGSDARRGRLRADTSAPDEADAMDPCAIAPDAQYRGTENQLYRVEIHSPGKLVHPKNTSEPAGSVVAPTFKWSRDNGTVAFVITEVDGSDTPWTVYLQDFGRDSRFSLDIGDWVEIIDRPARPLEDGAAPDLLRVTAVDPIDRSVTLERPLDQGTAGGPTVQGVPPVIAYGSDDIVKRKPILRRWDQSRGVVETRKAGGPPLGTIVIDSESNPDDPGTWFELEDGIRVQFQRPAPDVGSVGIFRPGDYWLIPARTASNGTIIWPVDKNESNGRAAVPPQGPRHSYAPLAVVVDPASNRGHPENWVIDRRTHINRGNIVTGPS